MALPPSSCDIELGIRGRSSFNRVTSTVHILLKFRPRSAQSLVWLGMLLAFLVIAWEAHRTISSTYRHEVDTIFVDTERAAQQLAMRTAEVFDRVNQSTLLIKYLNEQRSRPPLSELTRSGVIAGELLQSVYEADARGFVIESTSETTALNVADEEFFKRHVKAADLDVEIAPVWIDPLTRRAGIPVTRRLERDGGFDGIVTATVEPSALSSSYAAFQDKRTVVGVLGADGLYRSRTVDGKLSFGERLDPQALIARTEQARQSGVPGRSSVDGVARFGASAKVERYPLYAVVAVDADHALADYRNERRKILTWAALATTGVFIGTGFLLRLARGLDRSRAHTRRAEAAFRATLDGSLDSVVIMQAVRDPATAALQDLRILDCNGKAAAMAGSTRDELIGRFFAELMPSVRTSGFLHSFDAVMTTREPVQSERQATDPPLEGRWLHHQLVPLDDGVALITRDVTERRQTQAALEALSRIDSLTSLLNRRGFEKKLAEAIARAARSGQTLALLYIDLDGFKAVNDSLGHAAGDEVLTEVAHRLTKAVRVTDTVARLGGDEFAVVLEGAGRRGDIAELGRRLVLSLKAPHHFKGVSMNATPSIGIAFLEPDEAPESLCARADAAMYRAKHAGKSRLEWANESAAQVAVHKRAAELVSTEA